MTDKFNELHELMKQNQDPDAEWVVIVACWYCKARATHTIQLKDQSTVPVCDEHHDGDSLARLPCADGVQDPSARAGPAPSKEGQYE